MRRNARPEGPLALFFARMHKRSTHYGGEAFATCEFLMFAVFGPRVQGVPLPGLARRPPRFQLCCANPFSPDAAPLFVRLVQTLFSPGLPGITLRSAASGHRSRTLLCALLPQPRARD